MNSFERPMQKSENLAMTPEEHEVVVKLATDLEAVLSDAVQKVMQGGHSQEFKAEISRIQTGVMGILSFDEKGDPIVSASDIEKH